MLLICSSFAFPARFLDDMEEIHNLSKCAKKKQKIAQRLDDRVHLVGELMARYPLNAGLYMQVLALPSILHRIDGIGRAILIASVISASSASVHSLPKGMHQYSPDILGCSGLLLCKFSCRTCKG